MPLARAAREVLDAQLLDRVCCVHGVFRCYCQFPSVQTEFTLAKAMPGVGFLPGWRRPAGILSAGNDTLDASGLWQEPDSVDAVNYPIGGDGVDSRLHLWVNENPPRLGMAGGVPPADVVESGVGQHPQAH